MISPTHPLSTSSELVSVSKLSWSRSENLRRRCTPRTRDELEIRLLNLSPALMSLLSQRRARQKLRIFPVSPGSAPSGSRCSPLLPGSIGRFHTQIEPLRLSANRIQAIRPRFSNSICRAGGIPARIVIPCRWPMPQLTSCPTSLPHPRSGTVPVQSTVRLTRRSKAEARDTGACPLFASVANGSTRLAGSVLRVLCPVQQRPLHRLSLPINLGGKSRPIRCTRCASRIAAEPTYVCTNLRIAESGGL